jgi:hypothetical protein
MIDIECIDNSIWYLRSTHRTPIFTDSIIQRLQDEGFAYAQYGFGGLQGQNYTYDPETSKKSPPSWKAYSI